MCIWNKILVGLISVATLVLFYMAARALKTETSWSSEALQDQKQLKQLKTENQDLAEGTEAGPGIRQTSMEVHKLLLDRRRMWSNCDPKVKVGGGTAEIAVTINQTSPHGIAKGAVLYAFEEAKVENKGQYLGEFAVTNVGAKQVDFVPTAKLSPRELGRLANSKGPWVLYEIMPRDSHEVFASLTDEQKKAMLPAGVVQDYLKDGKPAAKDDPPDRVVDGNYLRPLLDFDVALNDERENQILLTNSIEAVQKDCQLVRDALAEGQAQEEAYKKEIASTTTEKEAMERERDVVKALRDKLETSLGAMQAWIARLIKTNQAMAGQIAKFQLEAARRIDQRTRDMAQSGAGRR